MKHLSMLAAGVMAFGLFSCTSNEPEGPAGLGEKEGDVFASLTLQLPSRAETNTPENGDVPASSTDGFEVGKDFENNVDQIFVILAEKTATGYKVISSNSSQTILQQSASAPTFSIQFQSEDLQKYVNSGEGEDTADKTAYVFAVCNPNAELQAELKDLQNGNETIFNRIMEETDADNLSAARKQAFLMSNALLATTDLPNYQKLVKQHNTQASAFNLGAVKVERAVSRFDFAHKAAKDGVPEDTYLIADNVSGLNVAYVQMQGMSLFNEAKSFNLYPQISNNADWSDIQLCGYELPNNWVVSPNADLKFGYATDMKYTAAIQNTLFNNYTILPQNRVYDAISDIRDADNDDSWSAGKDTDYRIWRYATENTLPTAAQKHALTTGIYFRGEILPLPADMWTGADKPEQHPAKIMAAALKSHQPIYAWTNANGDTPQATTMLGTALDVWKYAHTHNTSVIRNDFIAAVKAGVFTVRINDIPVELNETAIFPANVDITTVTVSGPAANVTNDDATLNVGESYNFMTYMPTKVGEGEAAEYHYYVYYPYFNVHNDLGLSGEMNAMQFATVRNNVYKLAVTNVYGFGTPGDIVPPPSTDDENPEIYFKVSVKVLDWVVRVNNIIF